MNTYLPKSEADAKSDGTLAYDAGDLYHIDFESDEHFDTSDVERNEILDFGDEGFLLKRLMTEEECKGVIESGEKNGFRDIRGVRDNYRSCKRLCIENEAMQTILWERIRPFLSDIKIDGDPVEKHIHGIMSVLQGTCTPIGLNKTFRLCRYFPGGHFAPHFDGFYSETSDVRSLQTLMLYLNGDFTGGSTNFVDEAQALFMGEDGKYCAEEKNIIHRIQPETGLGIIFNHHRLHEGQKLNDGVKYILRTDIMFRNQDIVKLGEKEEEAFKIIQEAETREATGDCLKAAELYRKAFKLSPTIAAAYKS